MRQLSQSSRLRGNELEAEFLYSWPGAVNDDDLGSDNTLESNSSIVLRLQYGEHVFLFMGDAEGKDREDGPDSAQYVERRLLDQYPDSVLKATVLKVGHHGSETSSTNEFIEVVAPEIVVVQSGRQNFNGTFIPDATVLQRYCAHDPPRGSIGPTRTMRRMAFQRRTTRTATTS